MTTRGLWTKFLSGEVADVEIILSDGTNTVTLDMPYVTISGIPVAVGGPEAIATDVTAHADDSGPGVADALTVALA
jgi:hypothetical protein